MQRRTKRQAQLNQTRGIHDQDRAYKFSTDVQFIQKGKGCLILYFLTNEKTLVSKQEATYSEQPETIEFLRFMERKLLVLLQILVEPAEHVCPSFFRVFDGERIVGVVSASEAVGHAREDLHEAVNLQNARLKFSGQSLSNYIGDQI